MAKPVLSVIIPFYNAENYICELLDCLEPQINENIEVILVDDGSKNPFCTDKKWIKVIRQNNKGLSGARNVGIEASSGDYIAFIDADDLVSENYFSKIFAQMPFDYLEMSWKSFQGINCSCKLNSIKDYLDNCSVWSRVYNRQFIGTIRFNENKDSTEDEDFTRRLGCRGATRRNRKVITDYVYFYRTGNENSLFNKYMRGECNTKRIVYYYPVVSKDMDFLLDEIKEEDKYNEVWVLTDDNQIPELTQYAQVAKPFNIRGMELRGMPTPLFKQIACPIKTQVVVWTNKTFAIGGIETFTYNFCMALKDYYDIVVLYNEMDATQINRLAPYVRVVQNNGNEVVCDTLIVNRIIDKVPRNIKYKKIIQMVHTCKHIPSYHIAQDRDMSICVSEACRLSFGHEGDKSIVLHNLMNDTKAKKALLLVSATRLDTNEKGQKRMLKLANQLTLKGIPYIWLYFSNNRLENAPVNMICMNPVLNIKDYIAMADYLVQLSDTESFCFSIVEALCEGVPVLCTKLPVLPEIGFKEGVNGYSVGFDDEEYDVEKFYNNQLKGRFTYSYDNQKRIKQWRDILGDSKPTHNYHPYKVKMVKVVVTIRQYYDVVLKAQLYKGQEVEMPMDRAYYLQSVKQFVEILHN